MVVEVRGRFESDPSPTACPILPAISRVAHDPGVLFALFACLYFVPLLPLPQLSMRSSIGHRFICRPQKGHTHRKTTLGAAGSEAAGR